MQTTDKATPSHESNRGSRSQSGARFKLLSDKATPSHEVKSACQPPRLAHVLRFDECKSNHFIQISVLFSRFFSSTCISFSS